MQGNHDLLDEDEEGTEIIDSEDEIEEEIIELESTDSDETESLLEEDISRSIRFRHAM